MDANKIISCNRMICASPFVSAEIKDAANGRPDKYFLEYLRFHNDYNLLMPVIEVIQSEQKEFGLIKESEHDVYGWHTSVVIFNHNWRNIYWHANHGKVKAMIEAKDEIFNPGQNNFVMADTKILALHHGTSFFIEQYNVWIDELLKQMSSKKETI